MNFRNLISVLVLAGVLAIATTLPCMAGEKLDQIRNRGTLLGATVNFTNEPFSFKDSSDKTVGLEVDLLETIAQKIGVKLELIEIPWDSGVTKCWDKDYRWDLFDIVAATITIKPSRAEVCGFSRPYYSTGQAVLTKKEGKIKNSDAIKGKSIGVMKGSTGYDCASTIGNPIPFNTYGDAVEALKMSIVPSAVMDRSLAIGHAKANPSLIVLDGLLTHEDYGVAFPKGDDELLSLLNEVVDENKDNLEKKWFK